MAKESFNDEEVSGILNEHFVSVKVDKEERPDIDHLYMEFCLAINGSGGWPLTIIMTPEQKPFFAATYLPRSELTSILLYIAERWKMNKEALMESSEMLARRIKEHLKAKVVPGLLDKDIIEQTFNALKQEYDPLYGGFGHNIKFPTPHKLLFLLRYSAVKDDRQALGMVEKTLQQMYKGGIFDHLGYGFSRYSTDRKWLVPHFEKMMYDNAFLAIAYLETYLLTKNDLYKDILFKILSFCLNEMHEEGKGFYTAIDADSEHEEGKYYLWDYSDLKEILNGDEFSYIVGYYNVTKNGNFDGKNILNMIHHDRIPEEDGKSLTIRKKLLEVRNRRIPPLKDDKILTSINGMMIAVLSLVGRHFKNENCIDIAKKTVDFILNNLVDDNGKLLSRYRNNEAKYRAYLDDYAFLVYGLIELFLATEDEAYLQHAVKFTDEMTNEHYDRKNGGFYIIARDGEELIIKTKDFHDGAIPSGNSMATMNLLRLGLITDNYKYDEIVSRQFRTIAKEANGYPASYAYMLLTYLTRKHLLNKAVFIYEKDNQETQRIKELLLNKNYWEIIVLNKEKIKGNEFFSHYANNDFPLILHYCENNVCNEPLTSYEDIVSFLEQN